jgi:phosphate transport system substrate-binding protein
VKGPTSQRLCVRLLVGAAAVLAGGLMPLAPSSASATEPINGGGSTWSAVAIQQWQADIARQGLTVNYQATGSTAGRQGYTAGTYDFAVSEIPFQPQYCTNPADTSTCYDEQTQPGLLARPYAYMPIVAGGTSLLYNVTINGQQLTGLQLSPTTLTKIFTGVVTNWDDPAIAADNPGVQFPNLKIQAVVRSDGAGTSYQFTAFMAFEDPTDWNAFCQRASIHQTPCPPTSQFPYGALPDASAQDGSDGVANWVAAPYNNGSIGYAEAAYGLNRGVPLASLQNAAHRYVQPTSKAVAVALTRTIINSDHTQNLDGVYTNTDPRAYPMSSYSYMIVPTSDAGPMDTSKGATLGQFILYFLCQGQQEAAPLGYSPLPPNLVQLGFSVEQQIPGAPSPPALSACNNPTITGGFLDNIGTPKITGQSGGGVTNPAPGATPPAGSSTQTNAPASASATGAGATGSGARAASGTAASRVAGGRAAAGTTKGSTRALAGAKSAGQVATDAPSELLSVGSPQNFGEPFRPIGNATAGLVIAVAVVVLIGPPTLAAARRRKRADRIRAKS